MDVKIDLPEDDEGTEDSEYLSSLGIDYENIVSRHRKFTVEFERTLAICVDQYKNLLTKTNRKDHLLRCFNSTFNNCATVEALNLLKKAYVECEECSGTVHCKVQGRKKQACSSKNSAKLDKDAQELEKRRKEELQNFINPNNTTRSTQPNIFVYPTQNILQRLKERQQQQEILKSKSNYIEVNTGSSLSDHIICLVRGKDNHSFVNAIVDTTYDAVLYLNSNVLPFIKIFSISILITVLQWILFIARVIYARKNPDVSEVDECNLFGAFSGNSLKKEIAVFRIFTSTFFHNSVAHLIISTIMHFRFSSVLERIHGATTTLVIYFLTSAYGMVGVCWYVPMALQANGFAGDWGVAGALLSRYFIFPYLIDREHQHIINSFVSLICLLFVKTIQAESSILVSTHLLSALAGFCFGTMINNRLGKGRCCGIANLMVDFLCSFTLLSVPVASIFALFLIKTPQSG